MSCLSNFFDLETNNWALNIFVVLNRFTGYNEHGGIIE